MRIGTIKQIWRYAVKSMAGEQLQECTVGERGIAGDRGWAIFEEATGKIAPGSRFPLLMQCAARYREAPANGFVPHAEIHFPDGPQFGTDQPDINQRLTELLGQSVSLGPPRGAYFDASPIHVLTTASLDVMARLNPTAMWDVRRFRPNFFVETDPGVTGLLEAEWTGQKLRLGSVELYCEIPAVRCGMAIQKQQGIPKDPSILRTIVEKANEDLGIYANVTKAGEVRLGDVVEIDSAS